MLYFSKSIVGRRNHDHMLVWLHSAYTINVYYYGSCNFDSSPKWGVLDTTSIKDWFIYVLTFSICSCWFTNCFTSGEQHLIYIYDENIFLANNKSCLLKVGRLTPQIKDAMGQQRQLP